jgi:hypothetical protein
MEKLITLLSALIISMICPGETDAAEILWGRHSGHSGLGTLFLMGQIEPGDYERFVAAIRERGAAPFILDPRSAGGNVAEAIKIGRLVRELGVYTQAPTAYMPNPENPSCHFDEQEVGKKVPCICASACTLIWFGGVLRTGAEIYIHSIAYERNMFGAVSPAEAGRMYKQAMDEVKGYLAEMSIDAKYAKLMTETGSIELQKIRPQNDPALFSLDPAYREWLYAKCGNPTNAMARDGGTIWGECTVRVQGEATMKAIQKLLNSTRNE